MIIHRDNYEMYFLLYVDNELSADERMAVEEFVLAYIDVKPELDLLSNTALPRDEIVFDAKAGLYKHELKQNLLEERMLLYLDNELDPPLAGLMEAEINADNNQKREWDVLQLTKLDRSEKISFENKQLLYRFEKSRVVSMRFWRAAAAAALIVGGIFIGFSIFKKDSGKQDVAAADKENAPAKKIGSAAKTTIVAEEKIIDEKQPADGAIFNVKNTNNNGGKINPAAVTGQKNIAAEKIDPGKHLPATTNRSQTGSSSENIYIPKSNETASATVKENLNSLTKKNKFEMIGEKDLALNNTATLITGLADKEITLSHNGYAKNTVVDQTASETEHNHILFINEEKINRSKMSGLFRKIKRVISRNANVKTGNSIQIAGFEIAAR